MDNRHNPHRYEQAGYFLRVDQATDTPVFHKNAAAGVDIELRFRRDSRIADMKLVDIYVRIDSLRSAFGKEIMIRVNSYVESRLEIPTVERDLLLKIKPLLK